MTTNQTIDGVPRAWLEEYEALADLSSGTAEMLRALLDAPETKNWEYFHNAMESERDYWKALAQKPADKHQGEPVVWLDPSSGRKANTISAALKRYNDSKGGAPAAATALYTVPLYAEQPAPVAVASRDESIYWLKRINGIGQARAELIYSMGFRRHTEAPQS